MAPLYGSLAQAARLRKKLAVQKTVSSNNWQNTAASNTVVNTTWTPGSSGASSVKPTTTANTSTTTPASTANTAPKPIVNPNSLVAKIRAKNQARNQWVNSVSTSSPAVSQTTTSVKSDTYWDVSGNPSTTAAPSVTAWNQTAGYKLPDISTFKYGKDAQDANTTDPTYLTNRNNTLAEYFAGRNITDENVIRRELQQQQGFTTWSISEQINTARAIAQRIAQNKGTSQQQISWPQQSDWQSTIDKIAQDAGYTNAADMESKVGAVFTPQLQQVWDASNPQQKQDRENSLRDMVYAKTSTTKAQNELNMQIDAYKTRFTPDSYNKVEKMFTDINQDIRNGMTLSQAAQKQWLTAADAANLLQGRWDKFWELTQDEKMKVAWDTIRQREFEKKQYEDNLAQNDQELQWLQDDYNKNVQRQEVLNEQAKWNISKMIGRMGGGIGTWAIEWVTSINEQARNVMEDMATTYQRSWIQIRQLRNQLIEAYNYNDSQLAESIQKQISAAKSSYFSQIESIKDKYGDVSETGQKLILEANKAFLQTFTDNYKTFYDTKRQLLTDMVTANNELRTQEMFTIQKQDAVIKSIQPRLMTMTWADIDRFVKDNNLPPSYVDVLEQQQAATVVDWLNSIKWLEAAQIGSKFTTQILDSIKRWMTPSEAVSNIVNSWDFQKTIDSMPMTPEEKVRLEAARVALQKWQIDLQNAMPTKPSSNSPTVAPETVQTAVKNIQSIPNGSKWGQCGSFVNNYLQSMGIGRLFQDPITQKAGIANSQTPSVGSVAIMDSPTDPQYWHVSIVTKVYDDWSFDAKDSNWVGAEIVGTHRVKAGGAKYWFYDPALKTTNANGTSNGLSDSYNPNMIATYTAFIEKGTKPTEKQIAQLWGFDKFSTDAMLAYTQNESKKLQSQWFKLVDPSFYATMSPDERKTFTNDTRTINNVVKKIDDIVKTVQAYDSMPLQSYYWDWRKLKAAISDLQLQLKNEWVYNLWVLNGPDLEVISSVIPQAWVQSWVNGKENYIEILNQAKNLYITQVNEQNKGRWLEFTPWASQGGSSSQTSSQQWQSSGGRWQAR